MGKVRVGHVFQQVQVWLVILVEFYTLKSPFLSETKDSIEGIRGYDLLWVLSLLFSEYVPCKGWEKAFSLSEYKKGGIGKAVETGGSKVELSGFPLSNGHISR